MADTTLTRQNTSIFSTIGTGKRPVICSPLYPFNEKLARIMFSNFTKSEFNFHLFSLQNRLQTNNYFTYNDLYNHYKRIITSFSNKEVTIVAFGPFTNLMLDLAVKYNTIIKKVILLEPDYSDILLSRLYDPAHKIWFKSRYLINFFCKTMTRSLVRPYISKLPMRHIRDFYNSTIDPHNDQRTLKSAMSHDIEIVIFWKTMVKESWPLAQVLEEYRCTIHYINSNILEALLQPQSTIHDLLKKELENRF